MMRNEPTQEDGSTEPTHDGGGVPNSRLSRRRLVAAGASTWLTISVAGCTGDGTDDSEGGDEDTTTTHTVTNRTTQTSPTTEESDTSTTTAETDAPTPTETTTSESGGSGTTTTCPSESLFPVGSPVGFLVGIFQTDSGDIVGPEGLEQVTVRFPGADLPPQDLSWSGAHADHVDNQWGGKLADTGNLDPGEYSYDIVVDTGSGEEVVQTGQFTLVDVDE